MTDDIKPVGAALAASRTSDVVDAHLVVVAARFGLDIITGDFGDITALTSSAFRDTVSVKRWGD
ncbi:hypothetical protein [Candidatus Poriferisodalis sp.]|uniref:hypothetical protein n=1 Tax=Candidatus Poriferisodalis sp. TaxID=3101277 RepID=UPI003B0137B3